MSLSGLGGYLVNGNDELESKDAPAPKTTISMRRTVRFLGFSV